jgi:hypothetical protein
VKHFFRAYEISTISTAIRASWEKTGFEHVHRERTSYIFVGEAKICAITEFAEVWRIIDDQAQLSARRRQRKWGWINTGCTRI